MEGRRHTLESDLKAASRATEGQAVEVNNAEEAVVEKIEKWEADGNPLHLLQAIAVLQDQLNHSATLNEYMSELQMSTVQSYRGAGAQAAATPHLDTMAAASAHSIGAQAAAVAGSINFRPGQQHAALVNHAGFHSLKQTIRMQGRVAAESLRRSKQSLARAAATETEARPAIVSDAQARSASRQ